MEIRFPDIPIYKGWGHPYRVEATIRGLELVEGHLPPEIEGTLLRCGPDRQYPPRDGSDVFIDGECMVRTFRFSGGQVDYMSRWVRTERYVLQKQARRALFGPGIATASPTIPRPATLAWAPPIPTSCTVRASCSRSRKTISPMSSIRRRSKPAATSISAAPSPA